MFNKSNNSVDFIPAKESRLFIRFFRIYVKLLFKRRFKKVWISQDYKPSKTSRTVYYLNHNSWWDGLIPLMLNEYRFKQQARALMEDKQMKKFSFFKRIGAFSINLDDPRKTITSLRYAVKSIERDHSCLFVYPEGQIQAQGSDLNFKQGLSWIHGKVESVDFVPIGIYIHTIRHDKPELHIKVGKPIDMGQKKSNKEKTSIFQKNLSMILQKLKTTAGFDDSCYETFL
ncbi:MAG: lysophospholipid acyltransferase family protein [Balneolaceae bacterium]|nr:lysophospholipid acyltransferase family protein [Balneolaceae bacterium]